MGSFLLFFIWVNGSATYPVEKMEAFFWFQNNSQSISIYLFTGLVFWFWIKDYCRISESYRYLIKSSYVLGLSLGLTLAAFCFDTIKKFHTKIKLKNQKTCFLSSFLCRFSKTNTSEEPKLHTISNSIIF